MENCLFGVSGSSYDHHVSSYGAGVFSASTKFDHYSPGGGGGGGGYVGPPGDPLTTAVGHQSSPYGGMIRENYCWDRELDENECGDLSSRSGSFCHQVPLMGASAATREGGLVAGEREAECGGGGGVGLVHRQSVDGLPLLESTESSACEAQLNAAAAASLLSTSSHHGYMDWKDASYSQSHCYADRYTDFCEPGHQQKPVHHSTVVCSLSQAEELYNDCRSFASNAACVGYNSQGNVVKAKQLFCQSPQPPPHTRPRAMADDWRNAPSTADDAIDDMSIRSCYQTGKLSVPPGESVGAGNRVQIPRIHSTSSDLPRSSNKDPNSAHSHRKQQQQQQQQPMTTTTTTTTPSGKRHCGDVSFTFIDDTEKKLWEKDRHKKNKHNMIERKRRLNINDKIKELGSLLPSNILSPPKDSLQNKGSILRASVDYIQHLQHELRRLSHAEQRAKEMISSNKLMKHKLKDLETFVRSAGLFEKYRSSSSSCVVAETGERYEKSLNH